MLTEIQRKHLRSLGHKLRPVVLIGNAGLSAAVMAEIDQALTAHELITVRLRVGDRDARDVAIRSVCRGTGAVLVQRIGHTALLYRRNPDKPRVSLP